MRAKILTLTAIVFLLGACDSSKYGKKISINEAASIANEISKKIKVATDYTATYEEKIILEGELLQDTLITYTVNRDGEKSFIEEDLVENKVKEYYLVNDAEHDQIFYETAKDKDGYYRQNAFSKKDFGGSLSTVMSMPNYIDIMAREYMSIEEISQEDIDASIEAYNKNNYSLKLEYYSKDSSSLTIKTLIKTDDEEAAKKNSVAKSDQLLIYENYMFSSISYVETFYGGGIEDVDLTVTYYDSKATITLPSDWASHLVSHDEWVSQH